MSFSQLKPIICTLGPTPGTVMLFRYNEKIIAAHQHSICALAITNDGTMLATASERGTLIRIWDTAHGTLIKELVEEQLKQRITSMHFNHNNTYLAVCSETGTLHVFSLSRGNNRKSIFSYDLSADIFAE